MKVDDFNLNGRVESPIAQIMCMGVIVCLKKRLKNAVIHDYRITHFTNCSHARMKDKSTTHKEMKQREEVQEDETEGGYHNQINSVTCLY